MNSGISCQKRIKIKLPWRELLKRVDGSHMGILFFRNDTSANHRSYITGNYLSNKQRNLGHLLQFFWSIVFGCFRNVLFSFCFTHSRIPFTCRYEKNPAASPGEGGEGNFFCAFPIGRSSLSGLPGIFLWPENKKPLRIGDFFTGKRKVIIPGAGSDSKIMTSLPFVARQSIR